MRNAINPQKPQVIMPFKYLDEVKSAPQSRLSFPLFSRLVCLSREVNWTTARLTINMLFYWIIATLLNKPMQPHT